MGCSRVPDPPARIMPFNVFPSAAVEIKCALLLKSLMAAWINNISVVNLLGV